MGNRHTQIVDLLFRHGELSLEQLADLLGVSVSTARREVHSLGDNRFVEETRGGIRLSTAIRYETIPTYNPPIEEEEARAIATRASRLIQRGDVIGLSGGRICTELALRAAFIEDIMVVTNALNIAVELTALKTVRVMVTGGGLNTDSFELVGPTVGSSLSGLHINKFFLGTDGISIDHGVTNHDQAEAQAAREIMQHSDATIILADSKKFNRANLSIVAPLSEFHALVTTTNTSRDVLLQFERSGIKVIVAEED